MATAPLKPVAGSLRPAFDLATAEVSADPRLDRASARAGKARADCIGCPAVLSTIDRDAARWTTRVAAFGSGWHRTAGSAEGLIVLAEGMGQQWLAGLRLALKLGSNIANGLDARPGGWCVDDCFLCTHQAVQDGSERREQPSWLRPQGQGEKWVSQFSGLPSFAKRGPAPKIQQQLEQIGKLSAAKQRAIAQVLDAMLQQHGA